VRDLTASPTAHVEVEPGGTEDGADLVGAEDFEHSSAVAPETPWFERAVSGGPTRYRSAQILEPGSVAPDGGVLVVAEPSRGELAVIFDDPAMN
ncbi:MAG: hypothetical protein JWM85_28, partial [Acidimicrobiaceae bacterium]|nr:hypothetical protein [Acidimicrobiaceae bacterium]